MTPRLENAIDTLSTAYLQGDLEAGKCRKCAVGNLLGGKPAWKVLFVTTSAGQRVTCEEHWDSPEKLIEAIADEYRADSPISDEHTLNARVARGKQRLSELLDAIKDTGYSVHELAEIERTFETTYREYSDDDYERHEAEFEALMAVVDLLISWDPISDKEAEEARAAFVE